MISSDPIEHQTKSDDSAGDSDLTREIKIRLPKAMINKDGKAEFTLRLLVEFGDGFVWVLAFSFLILMAILKFLSLDL